MATGGHVLDPVVDRRAELDELKDTNQQLTVPSASTGLAS